MSMWQLSRLSVRSSSTFPNNSFQWPFIRMSVHTSEFFGRRMHISCFLVMTYLRFDSSGLLVPLQSNNMLLQLEYTQPLTSSLSPGTTQIPPTDISFVYVHHVSDQQDGKLLLWVCDHLPQLTSPKMITQPEYTGWYLLSFAHGQLDTHLIYVFLFIGIIGQQPNVCKVKFLLIGQCVVVSKHSDRVGIIPLLFQKHTLFKGKGFGKKMKFLSSYQHSILNCHTRDIRAKISIAPNEIPHCLDMHTRIGINVF